MGLCLGNTVSSEVLPKMCMFKGSEDLGKSSEQAARQAKAGWARKTAVKQLYSREARMSTLSKRAVNVCKGIEESQKAQEHGTATSSQ